MSDYSKEYIRYYDNLKYKAYGKKKIDNKDAALKNKIENSTTDIYPTMRSIQTQNYQRGSYGYNRSQYNSSITTNKSSGYINRLITRLISTAMLFLIVLSLKVTPNDDVKKIYTYSKEYVSKDLNYKYIYSFANFFKSGETEEITGAVENVAKKIKDFILVLKNKSDSVNNINLNESAVDIVAPVENNSTNE